MIVAAGLTPAWQQIVTLDALRAGEVNRAQNVEWCASGKVLNVGSALHHLGITSKTVSFFGGETGELMQQDFTQLGIPTRWVPTATPTRVCTTILDRGAGRTTELVENSRSVSADELCQFALAFSEEARRADWVILTGSLPQHTPADFYRRLMESTTARVVLDVRGSELESCLPLRPFLVKPNREELAYTLRHPILTDDELLDAMQELRRRGAERVVVSQGPDELWFLDEAGLHRFRPPQVASINPIGCGDCLAAGIVAGYAAGMNDAQSIRFGIAAAAINVQHVLPSRLERANVERLAETIAAMP